MIQSADLTFDYEILIRYADRIFHPERVIRSRDTNLIQSLSYFDLPNFKDQEIVAFGLRLCYHLILILQITKPSNSFNNFLANTATLKLISET